MSEKTKITKTIDCRCGRHTTVDVKPATAYVEITRFMCDCGETFHIHDFCNGCTTYHAVTPEFDEEWLKEMKKHENRHRIKCAYPMSEFYIYQDEVPDNVRVSTPEDCEKCEEMKGCEDSKHCLFEESRHCLKNNPDS